MRLAALNPRNWLAAWISCACGAILILVLGLVTCLSEPFACSKDPCWTHWLRCLWTTINGPAVLALAAGVVTVIGFGTWKAQLRWTTRYNLALRVLRGLRGLSDAIMDTRQTLQHTASFRYYQAQGESASGSKPHFDPDQVEHDARSGFWQAYELLGRDTDEASHLWGEDAGTRLSRVFDIANEFKIALTLAEVALPRDQSAEPEKWKPRVVYAVGPDDAFTPRMSLAVGEAMAYFQKQL